MSTKIITKTLQNKLIHLLPKKIELKQKITNNQQKINQEFQKAFDILRICPPIRATFYGGARVLPGSLDFVNIQNLAGKLAKMGVGIVSGGGTGIMEASLLGAKAAQKWGQNSQNLMEKLEFEKLKLEKLGIEKLEGGESGVEKSKMRLKTTNQIKQKFQNLESPKVKSINLLNQNLRCELKLKIPKSSLTRQKMEIKNLEKEKAYSKIVNKKTHKTKVQKS